jgi:hypothetical protein
MEEELLRFSPENVLRQMQTAELRHGYYVLRFYVDERGMPSEQPTGQVGVFYLSPAGGILRDSNFNIILHSARFDRYHQMGWRYQAGEE